MSEIIKNEDETMRNDKNEEITGMTDRVLRYAGLLAVVSTMILFAGVQVAVAVPSPSGDAAVDEAANEFDTAQAAVTAAAPSHPTSQGLEDTLDEANQDQEEAEEALDRVKAETDPEATEAEIEAAEDAVEDAEEAVETAEDNADFHNGRVRDPAAANDYRDALEERRKAIKKLREQRRRWMAARGAPRTAAGELRVINARLKLAGQRLPSKNRQTASAATGGDTNTWIGTSNGALAMATGPEYAPRPTPSLGDFQEMQYGLAESQQQPPAFIPYQDSYNAGLGARGDADQLMNRMIIQREYGQAQEQIEAYNQPVYDDYYQPVHEEYEPAPQSEQEVATQVEPTATPHATPPANPQPRPASPTAPAVGYQASGVGTPPVEPLPTPVAASPQPVRSNTPAQTVLVIPGAPTVGYQVSRAGTPPVEPLLTPNAIGRPVRATEQPRTGQVVLNVPTRGFEVGQTARPRFEQQVEFQTR